MNAARAHLAAGARRGRGGSLIAALLSAAVLGALVLLAVTKLDPGAVGRALAHVNVGWLIFALLLMAFAFCARAESWYAVLAAAVTGEVYEGRLDRGTVRRALMIGMAGSALLPGRLGEGARTWVVARRLGTPSRSFAVVLGTVVSQTFLNLLALGILAVVAVLDSALAQARVEAIAAAVVLPAALIAVIFAGPPLLRRLGTGRFRRVRHAARWVAEQLVCGREGLAVFRKPRPALRATAAQMAAWALQWLACYATMLALGLQGHANLAAAAAVLLAVNLTAIVPLTPSNVGVFQAACIAVLHPFGVDASQALAYGLTLQAVEVFDALVLGGFALLREGLQWSDLRRLAGDRLGHAGVAGGSLIPAASLRRERATES
jgi:phosphatidylinositol alpha-mannosyltransferase